MRRTWKKIALIKLKDRWNWLFKTPLLIFRRKAKTYRIFIRLILKLIKYWFILFLKILSIKSWLYWTFIRKMCLFYLQLVLILLKIFNFKVELAGVKHLKYKKNGVICKGIRKLIMVGILLRILQIILNVQE